MTPPLFAADAAAGSAPGAHAPAAPPDPLLDRDGVRILCADSLLLDWRALLGDDRAALVLTDPPYGISVAGSAETGGWDSRDHAADYAAALRAVRPACRDNASALCFGHPGQFLGARSDLRGTGWHPLQDLVWDSGLRSSGRANPRSARAYYPDTERILFCEAAPAPGGPQDERRAEAAWRLAEERCRDATLRPLADYFAAALRASGLSIGQVRDRWRDLVPGQSGAMISHYLTPHQFELPTPQAYAVLQRIINEPIDRRLAASIAAGSAPGLRREYDGLRREYEDLRREYEDLRRPFGPDSSGRTPSDLILCPPAPVPSRLHPCQKPVALLASLIEQTTRPGDLVLDPFGGCGSTAVAALRTGRRCVLVERDPATARTAADRLARELAQPLLPL